MLGIELTNRTKYFNIEENWLTQLAYFTLAHEGMTHAMVEIALVDNPTIHEVNRKHLAHDYPTDVITFLYEPAPGIQATSDVIDSSEMGTLKALVDEQAEPDGFDDDGDDFDDEFGDEDEDFDVDDIEIDESDPIFSTLHGEVVLSIDYAVSEAAKAKWSLHEEMGLYVVHGILHLCGYDDQDPVKKSEMESAQESILRRFCERFPPASDDGEIGDAASDKANES